MQADADDDPPIIDAVFLSQKRLRLSVDLRALTRTVQVHPDTSLNVLRIDASWTAD